MKFRLYVISLEDEDFSQDFDTRSEAIAYAAWMFLSGYYFGEDGWGGEDHAELRRKAGELVQELLAGRSFEWDRTSTSSGYDAARIEIV